MKTKEIKQLIEILETSQINELSYKEEGFEISLKKGQDVLFQATNQAMNSKIEQDSINIKTIKSPLVGVYYGKPGPDEPSFVKVGDHVKVGDVLCIIEAMKVMNEIKSNQSGVIKEVLVKDGEPVSYDQDLWILE